MPASDLQEALADHLFHWGLRPFLSDREYERFQRDHLRPADLHQLRLLSEARQGGTAPGEADLAFYEYAAQPHIYPTLYSQRFDYYLTVGTAVAERLGQARRILDVGCGLGILTTFYARQAPEARVVGIDRSARSIEVARGQAAKLGLKQCTFTCHDLDHDPIGEPYDLIIASQALVQSERDPGLPSESWQTYARSRHNDYQRDFEQRTGIGHRLDHLRNALSQEGRALFCEKAHHLGRRVGFQRALAARGWHPVAPPAPIRYLSIEEVTDDGPLYELSPHAEHPPRWTGMNRPSECRTMQSSRTPGQRRNSCGTACHSASPFGEPRLSRLAWPPAQSSGAMQGPWPTSTSPGITDSAVYR